MRKLLFLCLLVLGQPILNQQAFAQEAPHVRAELVSSVSQIAAGETFSVILAQDIDPHWHTYWINPGDSGAAPNIRWQVPEGVNVGDFRYPFPERIPYGPLMNFGYHDEVRLPFEVTLPQDFSADEISIEGSGQILVCADICIPQRVTVSLDLPVGPTQVDETLKAYFDEAESRIPAPLSVPMSFTANDTEIVLTIGLPATEGDRIESVEYFPLKPDLIDNPSEQAFRMTESGLELTLATGWDFDAATADFAGIVVIHEAVGDGVVSSFEIRTESDGAGEAASMGAAASETGLLMALVFAFLGGLILNLMPCVFPVLSIKILSLVESVHEEGESIRVHGWAYAFGVVASFIAIAAVLMVLRAGGEAIGWGFQLQSPIVVSLLAYLFLVIGLNLMGVFEIALSVSDSGSRGYSGSISTGVLATVVAAPCTAPFMGAALGYALLQAPVTGILVFAALGFGMAVPYLLLCYSPALLARLPRPGNWMVTLRQALAFPMFASAIWLVWVLGIQAGPTAMMQLLGGGLMIAFGIWLMQQSSGLLWRGISILMIVAAISIGVMQQPATSTDPGSASVTPRGSASLAETYSANALEAALEQGPVFVNFTAAWCITCKVNELNALETDSVREAFQERGITYLKADWTNEDPKITAALQEYGRTGVPLYLLYKKGAGEAEVLPQILTPSIVIEALESI